MTLALAMNSSVCDSGGYPSRILQHATEVRTGQSSSLSWLDQCLDTIADARGEGSRTFLKIWPDSARAVAAAQDTLIRHGHAPSLLAGVPISVKDLLDIKGEVTRAGAVALDDAPAAVEDAPVVQRLRAAGAVLVGRTNMTQFAFSVVGLNPAFGTPGNPWDRARIPGGSSSGAAVSVADGMAGAAIGSDTVGSIRVPAALCGVVGYKPTQSKVPREGCIPLATTLDSIGPLAKTVQDCALVHAALAGEPIRPLRRRPVSGLRVAVPCQVVLDDLDHLVATTFERALSRLSRAGAVVLHQNFPSIAQAHALQGNAVIQPVEALAWHRDLLARRGLDYDPQIKARIESGSGIAATDYAKVLVARRSLVDELNCETHVIDVLAMPTVSQIAPTIVECQAFEAAVRSRLLRNSGLFNFFDRCAISIPIHEPGEAPVGLMLVGQHGADDELLQAAAAVEALF